MKTYLRKAGKLLSISGDKTLQSVTTYISPNSGISCTRTPPRVTAGFSLIDMRKWPNIAKHRTEINDNEDMAENFLCLMDVLNKVNVARLRRFDECIRVFIR